MNCLKKCSIEILNEKQDTGKDILGCLPTRVIIRIRELFTCSKKQKNQNKQKRSDKLVENPGSIYSSQKMLEKI